MMDVILVGASVRAAAESAQRAGLAVVAIDYFADTDTVAASQSQLRLDDVPAVIDLLRHDSATPVMLVGGVINRDLVREIRARPRFLGPSQLVAEQLTDPAVLAPLAVASGLSMPESVRVGTAGLQRLTDLNETDGLSVDGGRWLYKLSESSGGLAVRWANLSDSGAMPVLHDGYYQCWIAGRTYGAILLSAGDHVELLAVCRASYSSKRSRPFVYAGSAGPIALPNPIVASLRELGRACVKQFDLRGLFNIDFVVDRSGQPWLLEINPRWSAGVEVVESYLRDAGRLDQATSLFGLHFDACSDAGHGSAGLSKSRLRTSLMELTGCDAKPVRCHWKRIVYSVRSGSFSDRELRHSGLLGQGIFGFGFHARLADIPKPGIRIERGDPITTLIGRFELASATVPAATKKRLVAMVRRAVQD